MAAIKPRYSKEEFAKRGDAIFEKDIRPHLKNEDDDDFVAIDIETGAYEIDASELAACDRLRSAGARVLGGGEPKIGAHGKPVLFLHPKDFCGTLIELEEV